VGRSPGASAASSPIRVLVMIDHRMIREGMSLLLDGASGIEVAGALGRGEDLRDRCASESPDVVIMDFGRRAIDRAQISRLKRACPDARFVGLVDTPDERVAMKAVEHGLAGVYAKTRPSQELVDLVLRAAAGETVRPLRASGDTEPDPDFILGRLTARELEVLQELADGKPTAQVAKALSISPLTVQSHVKSILAKLGVHSKIEAVTLAYRHGMVARRVTKAGRVRGRQQAQRRSLRHIV
jgi:two-component system response regulator DevR